MGVMRRISRHPRAARSRLTAADDGFALIEVIASAVLFLVLATATLAVVDRSGKVATANRFRSVATGLAQADQDSMRQSPPAALTNLHATTTKTVDKVTYTIKSDAEWFRDATGVVSCTNSSARAEYVQITSTVTWPTMGSIRPIVMESYVTPGLTSLTRGALTVNLARADGTGAPGITVNATPSGSGPVSGATDANGCVVLGNLGPGTAATEWNVAGWVNKDGVTDVVGSANIVTGQTSNVNDSYDEAGKATIAFKDSNNADTGWPNVAAVQTGMSSGVRFFKDATVDPQPRNFSKTLDKLFPFTSNYSFYAGSCTGADPSKYQTSYSFSTGKVPRAGTLVPAQAVRLPVQKFDISGTTGASVVFMKLTPDTATSGTLMTGTCDTVRFQLGTSEWTSTNKWQIPLPFGRWKVCFDDGTKYRAVGTPIVNSGPSGTLAAGAPSPTAGTTSVSALSGGTTGKCP